MDNIGEFAFQEFDNIYTSIGIYVEHLIPHVNTQNGLVDSFIKCLKLIARLLLMNENCLHLFKDMLYYTLHHWL